MAISSQRQFGRLLLFFSISSFSFAPANGFLVVDPSVATVAEQAVPSFIGARIVENEIGTRVEAGEHIEAHRTGGIWGFGYKVQSMQSCDSKQGLVGELLLVKPSVGFGDDIDNLLLTVRYEERSRLHVHITSLGCGMPRWEVPSKLLPRARLGRASRACKGSTKARPQGGHQELAFSYTTEPFGFAVRRAATGEVLFNSTPPGAGAEGTLSADLPPFNPLIFKDQYLELSTTLPTGSALFGLGERTQAEGLRLVAGRTYTLWNSDIASSTVGPALYGSHPYYIEVRGGGSSHGVLLLNSNGMDVSYSEGSLTYRVIGGVLDFYFFTGPSPLDVIDQYTHLIGRPAPIPYWAFGLHQSKYGYPDVQALEAVAANYSAAAIPLEVMWSDIDYMDGWQDFTTDPVNYPEEELRAFVRGLHARGQRYVIILDPGIKIAEGYGPYDRGAELDVFIKDRDGRPYVGQVWPGAVHYPDFLHPRAAHFWGAEVAAFHARLPFDGLWIDMNEASNFCTGLSCRPAGPGDAVGECAPLSCCIVCNDSGPSRWDLPPYRINVGAAHLDLSAKAIATSARHHGGALEYDAHNLYGLAMAAATAAALRAVRGERPFVLSRSTFPGAGAHAAHWTGDNAATWQDLEYSVAGVLNPGLWGIPMAGADICGFAGGTTEELCARWIQIGAFYPFARAHGAIEAPPQELYRWPSVAESARVSLRLRYALLPTLYTLAYEAHMAGHPIARPLFLVFPGDPRTLGIHHQFMLGGNLLVSPVLFPGASSVEAYFPAGMWYDVVDHSRLASPPGGSTRALPAPAHRALVHVREGAIVALQGFALTTAAARRSPFSLLVSFGPAKKCGDGDERSSVTEVDEPSATGRLFVDSGESISMEVGGQEGTLISFTAGLDPSGRWTLVSTVESAGYAREASLRLDEIRVLGSVAASGTVRVNDSDVSPSVVINSSGHVMTIRGLDLALSDPFTVTWTGASLCR